MRDRLCRLRAIIARSEAAVDKLPLDNPRRSQAERMIVRCEEASRVVEVWLADPPDKPQPGG